MKHGSHKDWKTWKNGETFPVREKSGNFEQTVKSQRISPKILEKMRKFWPVFLFLFSLTFKLKCNLLNKSLYFLTPLHKALKNSGKWKENTGKVMENQGNLSV